MTTIPMTIYSNESSTHMSIPVARARKLTSKRLLGWITLWLMGVIMFPLAIVLGLLSGGLYGMLEGAGKETVKLTHDTKTQMKLWWKMLEG